jgi:hypothetical protein
MRAYARGQTPARARGRFYRPCLCRLYRPCLRRPCRNTRAAAAGFTGGGGGVDAGAARGGELVVQQRRRRAGVRLVGPPSRPQLQGPVGDQAQQLRVGRVQAAADGVEEDRELRRGGGAGGKLSRRRGGCGARSRSGWMGE